MRGLALCVLAGLMLISVAIMAKTKPDKAAPIFGVAGTIGIVALILVAFGL